MPKLTSQEGSSHTSNHARNLANIWKKTLDIELLCLKA